MTTEITTLYDLKAFLYGLTGDQLGQPIKILGIDGRKITEVEISEEDFIEEIGSERFGLRSEIEAELALKNLTLDKDEWTVTEPKGTVLFHAE